MSKLSQGEEGLLKTLWKIGSASSLREISVKTGLKKRSANMYLLRLKIAGYVSVSGEGHYALTESGKEILGFPKIDKDLAAKILGKTSPDESFNFYVEIDQPLGVSSDNLSDFCDQIKSVDIRSIEFHVTRGDFESWTRSLGDIELAKRLRLIREANLTGEKLRETLYKALKSRCEELTQKTA
jgi:hypothetical protein